MPELLVSQPATSATANPRETSASQTNGRLVGRVVEEASGSPLAGAKITVFHVAPGVAADNDADVARAVSGPDGRFSLAGLPLGAFRVEVRLLGFAPALRSPVFVSRTLQADIGVLRLARVATALERVQVDSERERVSFQLDRTSYTTASLAATDGGTAVDLLRSIPSVWVDQNNNVLLRNSTGLQVQINGRPSPLRGEQLGLYLAQLPAGRIARIEVSTTPSAKNDPDGGVGLVNLVLVQPVGLGLSGGVTAAIGSTGLMNPSGDVAAQKGRVSSSATYSYLRDERALTGVALREEGPDAASSLRSALGGGSYSDFHSGSVRTEYRDPAFWTLGTEVQFSDGISGRMSDAIYRCVAEGIVCPLAFQQLSDVDIGSGNVDATMRWRFRPANGRKDLSVVVRYSDADTRFAHDFGLQSLSAPNRGSTSGFDRSEVTARQTQGWRLQVDGTRQVGKRMRIEYGALATDRRTKSEFFAGDAGAPSSVALRDRYRFIDRLGSIYGVSTVLLQTVEAQVGLRLEQSVSRLDLPMGAARAPNRYDYFAMYPSVVLSRTLPNRQKLKLSYSRRVTRLDPTQLNPSPYREGVLNTFVGNPALRPEYANAFDVAYQRSYANGSFQVSPFVRTTPGAIRFLRFVDTAGSTRSTYANVQRAIASGVELGGTLRGRYGSISGGASVFDNRTTAGPTAPDVSFRGVGWTSRANVSWRVARSTSVQGSASYDAPMAIEGGLNLRYASTDFSIRRALRENRGSVSLSATDPFSVSVIGQRTVTQSAVQEIRRRFQTRAVRLSMSYRFGQPPKPSAFGEGGG